MKKIIEVRNFTYKVRDTIILKDITFSLLKGDFLCVIGPIGSGKSTLQSILASNNKKIRMDKSLKLVHVIPFFDMEGDTVYEYLGFIQSKEEIIRIAKHLGIIQYLDYKPSTLSYGIQCLVHLMKSLLQYPDILFLDNILDGLDVLSREKVLKYLRKLNRLQNITIMYATESMEDVSFFKKLLILNKGTIYYYGTLSNSLRTDEIWKGANLSYPFEIELSKKLKYYGLVERPVLTIDKLVDTLWK